MNTTERIVESYFRICRNCFTMSDVKVDRGNNRQLDLVAYEIETNTHYHIEIGVTHSRSFHPKLNRLERRIKQKFFGEPRIKERESDEEKEKRKAKNYFAQIVSTYRRIGLDPGRVHRIWVSWECRDVPELQKRIRDYCEATDLNEYCVEFISFRDEIIPELMKKIGTPNYGDDALRTFSLLRARERQARSQLEKDKQKSHLPKD